MFKQSPQEVPPLVRHPREDLFDKLINGKAGITPSMPAREHSWQMDLGSEVITAQREIPSSKARIARFVARRFAAAKSEEYSAAPTQESELLIKTKVWDETKLLGQEIQFLENRVRNLLVKRRPTHGRLEQLKNARAMLEVYETAERISDYQEGRKPEPLQLGLALALASPGGVSGDAFLRAIHQIKNIQQENRWRRSRTDIPRYIPWQKDSSDLFEAVIIRENGKSFLQICGEILKKNPGQIIGTLSFHNASSNELDHRSYNHAISGSIRFLELAGLSRRHHLLGGTDERGKAHRYPGVSLASTYPVRADYAEIRIKILESLNSGGKYFKELARGDNSYLLSNAIGADGSIRAGLRDLIQRGLVYKRIDPQEKPVYLLSPLGKELVSAWVRTPIGAPLTEQAHERLRRILITKLDVTPAGNLYTELKEQIPNGWQIQCNWEPLSTGQVEWPSAKLHEKAALESLSTAFECGIKVIPGIRRQPTLSQIGELLGKALQKQIKMNERVGLEITARSRLIRTRTGIDISVNVEPNSTNPAVEVNFATECPPSKALDALRVTLTGLASSLGASITINVNVMTDQGRLVRTIGEAIRNSFIRREKYD